MTKSKAWKYSYFIGIDISKAELDIALQIRNKFVGHYKIRNQPREITDLIKLFKTEHKLTIPNTVFGMEHIGIYSNHLIRCLEKLRSNIVMEDARRIRQSLGIIRGKNDKVDSIRISEYLVCHRDKLILHCNRRPIIDDLARLFTIRNRMLSTKAMLLTPLHEEKSFLLEEHSTLNMSVCDNTVDAIKGDIVKLQELIRAKWKGDAILSRLMELITSVDGIGDITALQIIISTNEFKSFPNARKFACYCGVAPFDQSSGTSVKIRSRTSGIANKKLKSLLHVCAMSACTHSPELREYYLRRTKIDGKPKMSVLNAIRFKLITRMFTCVSQDRIYQSDYVRK